MCMIGFLSFSISFSTGCLFFVESCPVMTVLDVYKRQIMSYICYTDQPMKFMEASKAQEENEAVYTIEAM